MNDYATTTILTVANGNPTSSLMPKLTIGSWMMSQWFQYPIVIEILYYWHSTMANVEEQIASDPIPVNSN